MGSAGGASLWIRDARPGIRQAIGRTPARSGRDCGRRGTARGVFRARTRQHGRMRRHDRLNRSAVRTGLVETTLAHGGPLSRRRKPRSLSCSAASGHSESD